MSTEPRVPLRVTVNGAGTELPADSSVADLVARTFGSRSSDGVAVALNGAVVPRSRWAQTVVPAEAAVEIVTATQGG